MPCFKILPSAVHPERAVTLGYVPREALRKHLPLTLLVVGDDLDGSAPHQVRQTWMRFREVVPVKTFEVWSSSSWEANDQEAALFGISGLDFFLLARWTAAPYLPSIIEIKEKFNFHDGGEPAPFPPAKGGILKLVRNLFVLPESTHVKEPPIRS